MNRAKIKNRVKLTLLAGGVGVIASLVAALFLWALNQVTELRETHPLLVLGLPLAGLSVGHLYYKYGQVVSGGTRLILAEIHNPKQVIPGRMAPLIFVTTLISHLCGASVGREGTVVQMGAALADRLTRYFKLTSAERRALLMAGASAGFGSAIGVPFAGLVFGMEFAGVLSLKNSAWSECLMSSLLAYLTTSLIGTAHLHFAPVAWPTLSLPTLFSLLFVGVLFGLMVQLFCRTNHFLEQLFKQFIPYKPLHPFLGGIIILILYYIEGTFSYSGLGLPVIQTAMLEPVSLSVPLLKLLFTTLAIAATFKGGEFTPLVFIGVTLGSALAAFLPVPLPLLAALGFVSLFAGASKTPVTCTLMAIELFGPKIAPFALITCLVSYYVAGKWGIYKEPLSY